jgi:predicted  nucleic acid-binding Zn-ribbon protein
MAKKKIPAPQDSTRRNVQAANKRLDKLESAVHTLTDRIEALEAQGTRSGESVTTDEGSESGS